VDAAAQLESKRAAQALEVRREQQSDFGQADVVKRKGAAASGLATISSLWPLHRCCAATQ
jgi:hypothetical protein